MGCKDISKSNWNITSAVTLQKDYRIGVPKQGYYEEILNSDSSEYWGSNVGNYGGMWSENISWQGKWNSMTVTIAPLGAIFFKYKK